MKRVARSIATVVFLALGTLIFVTVIPAQWSHFQAVCPNKDVLSWDANARLTTVLDQYQDFHDGRIWRALAPFEPIAHSVTWPYLRSIISLALFEIHPAGPDTVLDLSISFVFYALLFPSILIIAFEICRDWFRASLAWFATTMILVHTSEIPMYALSSMLETQGMFFMLWTCYFLFKLYEQQQLRAAFDLKEAARFLPRRKRIWLGLFIFSQGLFHTKYPYGVMLIVALIAYELLRSPRRFLDLGTIALSQHFRGPRRFLLMTIIGLVVLFAVWTIVASLIRSTTGADISINNKSVKYIFWFLALATFVDFNIAFLWRYRFELGRIFDTATRQIYACLVFPMAIWMLISPNRVSSTLGTQQHQQDAGASFLERMGEHLFDDPLPFLMLVLGTIIALAFFFAALFASRRSIRATYNELITRPRLSILIILSFNLVILEVLTSNNQLRHIYHLLPAILLFMAAWVLRAPRLFNVSKSSLPWQIAHRSCETLAILVLCAPILLGNIYFGETPAALRATGTTPRYDTRLEQIYAATRPTMCFTSENVELFEPPRWLARQLRRSKRYIFFNSFHDTSMAHRGRLLATDFDVLFRMYTMRVRGADEEGTPEWGAVRNWSRSLNWDEFDAVLLLTPTCRAPRYEAQLAERARENQRRLLEISRKNHVSGGFCLREYTLVDAAENR